MLSGSISSTLRNNFTASCQFRVSMATVPRLNELRIRSFGATEDCSALPKVSAAPCLSPLPLSTTPRLFHPATDAVSFATAFLYSSSAAAASPLRRALLPARTSFLSIWADRGNALSISNMTISLFIRTNSFSSVWTLSASQSPAGPARRRRNTCTARHTPRTPST